MRLTGVRLEDVGAVRLARSAVIGQPDLIQPMPSGGWLLHCRLGTPSAWEETIGYELTVMNDRLEPVWRLRPPPEPSHWEGTHAVADDLSLVALSLPGEVRLLDGRGRPVARFPAPTGEDAGFAAGGCAFTADGRWLWACVPLAGQGNELWLIDLAGPGVADRRALESDAQRVVLHRHPDGQGVGLNLWAGNKAVIRWARLVEGRIELQVLPEPAALRDIHPAGHEYLATPQGEGQSEQVAPLTRRRYPDGAELERLAAGEWEATAGYLTDELLVAEVWRPDAPGTNRHLLLRRDPLSPIGQIRYPDGADRLPGYLSRSREGRWLTVDDGIECWALTQGPVDRRS